MKKQLNESIEKVTNAINVIELYQGIINWSSVAPEKSGSPKYYIGLLEKNLDTMYSMNQKLIREIDEVGVFLQDLEEEIEKES